MTGPSRRTVLRGVGATALAAAFPETIKRALAIQPASVTGTIQDVQHIVVLMQENRSFDHYFGSLQGVRGFSDPRPVTLSTGRSVFYQPNGSNYVLPFHPTAPYMGYQFLGDLAHSWSDAHEAWNNGNNDKWVAAKGTETMAYLTRADIPFHYALADAFTICDNYHCSIMSSTDPNRYYMWTGWVGQNGLSGSTQEDTIASPWNASVPGTYTLSKSGSGEGNGTLPGGPVVNNAEQGYNWLTYPEMLSAAGVTWKTYQDIGIGLDSGGSWGWTTNPYIGNYGDNSLLYFLQYQDAPSGSALYEAALTGTNIYDGGTYTGGSFFAELQNDVTNGTLPQVSWVVAPQAYCEHPAFPPNWGAWYISNVLAALTSNPEVWASTVLIINFDENDGFFDHIVAPTPPMTAGGGISTVNIVNEIYSGISGNSSYTSYPYGLGARVPLLVVSPWSKGGWVCSQVFDHTSVIQFIEQRFGVICPHITPWRRTVCGDLTSALNFAVNNATGTRLPSTSSYLSYPTSTSSTATLSPLSQSTISSGAQPVGTYSARPPSTQTMPTQEPGQRLARALPYQLQADATQSVSNGSVTINFTNAGTVGTFFHVRTALGAVNGGSGTGPWGYTLDPTTGTLSDTFSPTGSTSYNLSVFGPNGFYRQFAGGLTASSAVLNVQAGYDGNGGIILTVTNNGAAAATVTITDNYTSNTQQQSLNPGANFQTDWTLQASSSWYDLLVTASTDPSFAAHYAGHVETGQDGVTDPLIGAA